jgi:hypothetical protein
MGLVDKLHHLGAALDKSQAHKYYRYQFCIILPTGSDVLSNKRVLPINNPYNLPTPFRDRMYDLHIKHPTQQTVLSKLNIMSLGDHFQ